MTNSLVAEAQIISAVDWCLACFPGNDVIVLGEVLWQFVDDFSEGRQEVAAALRDLRYSRNRKSSWSLACAIIAHEALRRDNPAVFWSAGFEVLKSFQQAMRGTHHNRKTSAADALDACIAEYLSDFPATSSNEMFQSYADACVCGSEVFVEYDSDKDELVCQLSPSDKKLTNVGREEFARRIRRATGCMQTEMLS